MDRPKGSKSASEMKREESRRKIMKAALKLFFIKGYENTTTRDIIKETGILNGSLYNRFKSKDEILFGIVSDVIVTFLNGSEKLMIMEKDPFKALVMPMAVELYIASHNKNMADLIFHAHKSWDAIDSFVDMYRNWLKSVWMDYYHEHIDEQAFRLSLISVIGAVGNICGEYAHGYDGDYGSVLENLVKGTSMIIGVPMFEVKNTVAELRDYIEHGDLVIFDYKLSDLETLGESTSD